MQKISSATDHDYSVAYSVVFADDPAAARIISDWATEGDRRHVSSRRLGAESALLARAGLRSLLYWLTKTVGWTFDADALGKPFVSLPDCATRPHISLAHSRGAVACAVTHAGPIGIDLELHTPRDHAKIAGYAFGPLEQARIQQEGLPEFYRVWTLREAIAKATGQGLAQVVDRVDRGQDGPGTGVWITCCEGEEWLLSHVHPAPDFSLAIATLATRQGSQLIHEVSAEELARPRDSA